MGPHDPHGIVWIHADEPVSALQLTNRPHLLSSAESTAWNGRSSAVYEARHSAVDDTVSGTCHRGDTADEATVRVPSTLNQRIKTCPSSFLRKVTPLKESTRGFKRTITTCLMRAFLRLLVHVPARQRANRSHTRKMSRYYHTPLFRNPTIQALALRPSPHSPRCTRSLRSLPRVFPVLLACRVRSCVPYPALSCPALPCHVSSACIPLAIASWLLPPRVRYARAERDGQRRCTRISREVESFSDPGWPID